MVPLVSANRRMAGLDVLRGIAILLVLLHHGFPTLLPGGGVVGVVMFFTLSGFLITRSLLGEVAVKGRLDLPRFAWRRALRLLPPLWLMLAGYALITLLFDPVGDRSSLPKTLFVSLTYTTDMPFSIGSHTVFHLWTLATEAQFYLIWPAVILIGIKTKRLWLVHVAAAALVLAGCLAGLSYAGSDFLITYRFPTSWGVVLVIGAAVALATHRGRGLPRFGQPVMGLVALCLIGWFSLLLLPGEALTYFVFCPLIALATSLLIMRWSTWEVAFRPMRLLVMLGMVSYGAYLWNYPIVIWLRSWNEAWSGPLSLVLTLMMATLSWKLLERPLLDRMGRKPTFRKPTRPWARSPATGVAVQSPPPPAAP